MGAVDIIVILSIVLIIGAALSYIIIAKRRGARCIGCPYAKSCGGKCPCSHTKEDK
jgi:radical SAM protein with 4Fe4S-binding SPASM domain